MPKLLYPVNMFIGFNNLYISKVINCLQNVYMRLTVPHNSSVRQRKKITFFFPFLADNIEALKSHVVSESWSSNLSPNALAP